MKLFYLLILNLFIFPNFAEEKYMYVLGGGGEPKGTSTNFDKDLKNLSKFAKNSKWKTTVLFNGGHSETEEIAKVGFPNSTRGDFNEANFNAMLKDLLQKLQNGEIKSGDKLMLMIDSHGAGRDKDETSHRISLARGEVKDLNTLSGSSSVSLDKLKPIIEEAKKQGVKLAIIDNSCHSGNTLNLDSSSACIISAAGKNHYGYGGTVGFLGFSLATTFNGIFVKEMKEGKNLEDIFLEARKSGVTPDFPMISTEEGRLIQDQLYDLITPYLYYNDAKTRKFDAQYSVKNIDEISCKMERNFSELENFLNGLNQLGSNMIDTYVVKDLKNSLLEYRQYQLSYEQSYKDLKAVGNEIKDMISKRSPAEAKLFSNEEPTSIINTNFDESLKILKALVDKHGTEMWKRAYNETLLKKQIAEEIKATLSKESKDLIDNHKKMYESSGKTFNLAMKVSKNAKAVYDQLYKLYKPDRQNPCKGFEL